MAATAIKRLPWIPAIASAALLAAVVGAYAYLDAQWLRIAIIAPVTGPNAVLAQSFVRAAEIAKEDLGAKAERIQLVIVDSTGTPEQARDSIDQLFAAQRIDAVLGAVSASGQFTVPYGSGMARIGSDSRLAHIEGLSEDLFAPPTSLVEAFSKGSKGLRLIVVTPAKFQNGWLPSGFTAQGGEFRGQLRGIPSSDVVLRAAFVPRPIHVSGWNMTGGGSSGGVPDGARKNGGPKETSRLVPSGAVYFFECINGNPFSADDARKLWLAALGARTDEGLGLVVPALWTPRR